MFDSDPTPDSDPPEESSYHAFVLRGEWRESVRARREWEKSTHARLRIIEKKLTVYGLVLAAISAGSRIPWEDVARALGW